MNILHSCLNNQKCLRTYLLQQYIIYIVENKTRRPSLANVNFVFELKNLPEAAKALPPKALVLFTSDSWRQL